MQKALREGGLLKYNRCAFQRRYEPGTPISWEQMKAFNIDFAFVFLGYE